MINRLIYFMSDFKWYLIIWLFITLLVFIVLLRFRRQWILALLTTSYCLLVTFLLTEIYFRYVYDSSDGLGFLKVNQKWHERHVVYNGDFRRDRQFTQSKQPGEIRIAAIGDSLTFGGGIKNPQDRFSNLLETKLRADGLNVSVYNFGIPGTGTDDEIKDFKSISYLNFDLVIWEYYLNDANSAKTGTGTQIIVTNRQNFTPRPLIKFFTDRSFFADWLYWRLSSRYDQTFRDLIPADLEVYDDPVIFNQHQAQIAKFIKDLHSDHIPVIVAVFPFLYPSSVAPQEHRIYQKMLNLFQTTGADAVINLETAFQPYSSKQLMASRFDSHPNELAHRLTADLLYASIKSLLLFRAD